MRREIDTIPAPAHVKQMKLIVLSAPRTGTHALYEAFRGLGYKPYHMEEVVNIFCPVLNSVNNLLAKVVASGVPAIRIMTDAMRAELFHEGTPYGRQEFDKWFADYDVIIEMPFFMLRSILKAYPDANFLLTERDPEKWAKSFLNSIGVASARFSHLPMSVFKHFDSFASNMGVFATRMLNYWTNGSGVSIEGHQALVENYEAYIADVKQFVPPEQLKVFKLEDGFGWNELCSYLGIPIPDNTPWPSLNTPEEFHSLVRPKIQTAVSKGIAGVAAFIAIVAVVVWYGRKSVLLLMA